MARRFPSLRLRDSRRESGETLVEVLVTVVIVGLSATAIIGSLLTSTAASAIDRNIGTVDTVLRGFADTARTTIETAGNGSSGSSFTTVCSPAPSYKVVGAPWPRTGLPGSTVSVFGTGFASWTQSQLTPVGGGSTITIASSPRAGLDSASGEITQFTIPTGTAPGVYSVTPFGTGPAAAAYFTVLPTGSGGNPASAAPLNTYKLTSTYSYWDTSTSSWSSSCPASGTSSLQQLTFDLQDTKPGNGAADLASVILGNFQTKSTTITTLSSSANPSVVGQTVTYTATVSVVSGSGTPPPTDTVTFYDNGTAMGCPNNFNGATATCTTTYNALSSGDSITAVFSGDTTYSGSATSAPLVQTVNQAQTTTSSVTATPNPSVVGQPVTYSANVSVNAPGAGTPTGTVTFSQGATALCSAGLSSGSASCPYTPTAPATGTTITATYSGDTSFAGSVGSTSETINKAATATGVSSSANPSAVGQAVTFTASVSVTLPGAGTPTGTVNFTNGGTPLCTNVTLSASGTAPCTYTFNSATSGTTITATYSGDGNFNGSSGAVNQVVSTSLLATTTSLTGSPSSIVRGNSVTYTATVSSSAGTPAGTVTFSDGAGNPATVNCAAQTLSGGVATCTVVYPSKGSYTVIATYSGSATYAGSTSSPVTEVVTNK